MVQNVEDEFCPDLFTSLYEYLRFSSKSTYPNKDALGVFPEPVIFIFFSKLMLESGKGFLYYIH